MKLYAKTLVLAPLFFALAGFGEGDALERGLELFRQQKYEAALDQFQQARRTRPANAQLENFIGITETRLGQIDAADKDYQTAIRLDPNLADAHKNLGYNYIGKAQYGLAEKELKAALALDGTEPLIHYYLVILYLTTSRDKDVLVHLKPAESVLVNDTNSALLAIKASLKENDRAEALKLTQLLEQTSRLTPEQEYAIAQLFDERQMYSESVERFRRIAQLQPASWQDQYNLAVALVKAKQSKEALPLLATLSAEHATDANVLTAVASTYESGGENSLAVETYRKAIAADPINPDRYLDGSRLLIDLDRYDEATEIVRNGISLVPDPYPLTIRLGAIAMMRGNRAQARDLYRSAIAEHPAIALAYVALAQTYMKEGNDEEALKILSEGRAAVPRDFALEYVYGLASSEMGQQQQALEALKSAEGLSPAVVEPHYQVGLLYMKQQQWKEAQEEFEQVLKLDPHNAATYYQLSRTYQRLGEMDKAQEMGKEAALLTRTQREAAVKEQELRFGVPSQE
jgi:tetratricopeptide (TPR) repeat protein